MFKKSSNYEYNYVVDLSICYFCLCVGCQIVCLYVGHFDVKKLVSKLRKKKGLEYGYLGFRFGFFIKINSEQLKYSTS